MPILCRTNNLYFLHPLRLSQPTPSRSLPDLTNIHMSRVSVSLFLFFVSPFGCLAFTRREKQGCIFLSPSDVLHSGQAQGNPLQLLHMARAHSAHAQTAPKSAWKTQAYKRSSADGPECEDSSSSLECARLPGVQKHLQPWAGVGVPE